MPRIPASNCPDCGACLNGTQELIGKGSAAPGVISLCFYCGALLLFTETLRIRKMSLDEFKALSPHNQRLLVNAQAGIRAAGKVVQ